jgi:hypothetical protein
MLIKKRFMFNRLKITFVALMFGLTSFCLSPAPAIAQNLPNGDYLVQQAAYNDLDGEYSLMLLNTPKGAPPVLKTQDLQMARLSETEIAAGQKSHLTVENEQNILYLDENFRIEYIHSDTENQTNPQTGQPETVIIRRESSFWTPFAGAIAGQMVANALFSPMYYVPPLYRPGAMLTGYGSYGNTYTQAVQNYSQRYNQAPPSVQNRQNFRKTGTIRTGTTTANRRSSNRTSKATGSGFGTSTLRRSNQKTLQRQRNKRFGSGMTAPRRSFGRRR